MRGSNDKAATTVAFVLKEFERIGALIAHINKLTTTWQSFGTLQPQATFSRLAVASLSRRFTLGRVYSVMQHLVGQAKHFPFLGVHGQTILADVTPMMAVTDLPKTRKRLVSGEIEFGRVMDDQYGAPNLLDDSQRPRTVRGKYGLVSDITAIAKTVESLQICGRPKLIRQRASGMSAHRVGASGQTLGPSLISQLCATEMHFTETLIRVRTQNHGGTSLKNETGVQSVTCHSSMAVNPPRHQLAPNNRYSSSQLPPQATIAA
jgi:hypothetical protein